VTDADLGAVVGERRHLLALAYRMLGTMADAEDAVQETYARWYRLSEAERDAIELPRAWLTRVASRICLDTLRSARVRRERYVGEWLPEPVPAAAFAEDPADPADRVTLDATVSTALLVVLESLTPAERVAFVLHDVFALPFTEVAAVVGRSEAACRQLAVTARRRIRAERAAPVSREQHDRVVRAFGAACRNGDLAGLAALLDPAVTLRSDGGGVVSAARRPVRGPNNVARFMLGILAKKGDLELVEVPTTDGLAFMRRDAAGVHQVINLRVAHGRVTDVWIVLNPAKLTRW
jgi:RNA polymerase sigma-70 factor (ECF subfamily)